MWAAALGRWINTSSAGNGPALPPPAVTLGLDPAHGWAWRPAPAIGPARARGRSPGRGGPQLWRVRVVAPLSPPNEFRDGSGGVSGALSFPPGPRTGHPS